MEREKKEKATKNKLYYETKKKGGKASSIQPTVNENISKTALRKRTERMRKKKEKMCKERETEKKNEHKDRKLKKMSSFTHRSILK